MVLFNNWYLLIHIFMILIILKLLNVRVKHLYEIIDFFVIYSVKSIKNPKKFIGMLGK